MSTITDMTGDRAPAAETAPSRPAPAVVVGSAPTRARQRTIPLPTAMAAALIAGLFGMLFWSLNALNGSIGDLRDDMNTQIGMLRSDMDTQIGMLLSDMDTQIGSLRGEIGALRSDMDTQIGSLRGEIGALRSDMNAQIGMLRGEIDQINAVLLDHTDRLARIETHLEIIRQPDTQAAGSSQ